jgi:hypothetical protein
MTNLLRQQTFVGPEQEAAWRSVSAAEKIVRSPGSRVFEGKKVILGCQIEVSPDFRVAIEETVVNAGGIILPEERLRECDIYVTPWREGKQYLRVSLAFGYLAIIAHRGPSSGRKTWKNDRRLALGQSCHQSESTYSTKG